jgi:glycosyltransferase involved in cell wall biosynthesis
MTAIGNALRFNVFATEQDICQKQKTVIVVARFDEDTKRISYVLCVWREIEKTNQYADWKLQLVGDGRDKAFYHYLVKNWNLQRVEFVGQQDPQEYYRSASLFLMTSTAEGWGMVLTEAQQMGVPVVAMDSFGALHDIIEDGYNGRIVPNNDLVAFQNAMMQIMADEAKRKEMALHAIESSKRYEIQHILLQWQKLFEQMKE